MNDDRIVPFGGTNYRIGRLDPFVQFHVARRLAPILANLGTALKEAAPLLQSKQATGGTPEEAAASKDAEDFDALAVAIGPIAETLAKMSDEDVDYILHKCLAVCQRDIGGGKWAPVQLRGGTRLMFEDIDLPTLMGLTINTIQDNLSSFFPTGPQSSAAAK